MSDDNTRIMLRRWRLMLGHFAADSLDQYGLSVQEQRLDQALDYLYGREYERRGVRRGTTPDASAVRAIDWLHLTRKLFPRDVYERIQAQAIEKYQLTDLLHDPAALATLEPNQALVRTLLGLRGKLGAEVIGVVRTLLRLVVEDITRRLRTDFVNALQGRRNRFRRSALRSAQNFDWRATLHANLKHYDPARKQLVIERVLFNARTRRALPWEVILCVDQSGSMTDSVMYAAIVAGILAGLPGVRVKLVVFDTAVVDLTHMAHDPVEVLLTVQLGGGTDIGRAMRYCEQCVDQPHRSVVALISDFFEGMPIGPLLDSVRRMAEARVTLLGLAALDETGTAVYDRDMAQRLGNLGMHVAALTPTHFAEWLAEVMG